jgi:hypothetical protein
VGVEADAASGQPQADNTGKEMSLQDAISAALAASKGDSDEQPETTPEPKAEAKEADASVEAEAGEGRTSEDARKPETSQDSKDAGEAVKKDDAPAFEAPEHWSEAHRKAFAELDAKAKEIVRDLAKSTQSHLTRRSQELGDKARYADAVRSVIDDSTRNKLALQGANEFQYIQRLHEIQQFSERDPTGFVKWSIQTLGIKPEDLFPAQKQPAQQQQSSEQDLAALLADPRVNDLETRFAQLQRQWEERQQREQAYQQQQRLRAEQGLQNIAGQFRGALDDSGQLQHPHFDAVQTDMAALMLGNHQLMQMPDGPEKLQAAYDMAVWARPDLRQNLLEAEAAKRVQAVEKAREVARAKSVTQVKPAPAVAATQAKPTDLSSIVREQLNARGFGA